VPQALWFVVCDNLRRGLRGEGAGGLEISNEEFRMKNFGMKNFE
jgi:hypothetical protein